MKLIKPERVKRVRAACPCLLGLALLARANAAEPSSGTLIAEDSDIRGRPGLNASSGAQGAAIGDERDGEGALHGFPTMFDLQGKKLANGEFTQWLENDLLHVNIVYDFGSAHRIEEKTVFRQKPRLVQEEWIWRESQSGKLVRYFEVDFKSGKATAGKVNDKKTSSWSENLKIEPGRTFAGFGFVLALKSLRDRLVQGEKVELKGVGFTPKPRICSVELSCGGLDRVHMGDRVITGDRFVIHPKVPAIAKAFVDVKDTHIWLTIPHPPGFLRWEGPLVEAGDPVHRVDLLTGERSGPAEPVRTDSAQSK
jgi:hypothetical protein